MAWQQNGQANETNHQTHPHRHRWQGQRTGNKPHTNQATEVRSHLLSQTRKQLSRGAYSTKISPTREAM